MWEQFGVRVFWLLVAHALADFPLQGDFLALAKNVRHPLAGVPAWLCLLAHALIHAGAVALVTESITLGMIELAVHTLIDFGKIHEVYSFTVDQMLHVAAKIAYALILSKGVLIHVG